MSILALDISTKCGWAGLTQSGSIRHGTFTMPGTAHPRRLVAFHDFVEEKIFTFRPAILAYEAQFFKGHGSHMLMWLAGIVNLAAQKNGVAVHSGFANVTIKKAFTGTGKASKEQMLDRCRALGLNPQDDNAADAIALLTLCMKQSSSMKEKR